MIICVFLFLSILKLLWFLICVMFCKGIGWMKLILLDKSVVNLVVVLLIGVNVVLVILCLMLFYQLVFGIRMVLMFGLWLVSVNGFVLLMFIVVKFFVLCVGSLVLFVFVQFLFRIMKLVIEFGNRGFGVLVMKFIVQLFMMCIFLIGVNQDWMLVVLFDVC